jgi:hypothetical protein
MPLPTVISSVPIPHGRMFKLKALEISRRALRRSVLTRGRAEYCDYQWTHTLGFYVSHGLDGVLCKFLASFDTDLTALSQQVGLIAMANLTHTGGSHAVGARNWLASSDSVSSTLLVLDFLRQNLLSIPLFTGRLLSIKERLLMWLRCSNLRLCLPRDPDYRDLADMAPEVGRGVLKWCVGSSKTPFPR